MNRRIIAAFLAGAFALLCTTVAAPAMATWRYVCGTLSYADQEVWGTSKGSRGLPVVPVTVKLNGVAQGAPLSTSTSGFYAGWFDLPTTGTLTIEFQSRNASGYFNVYDSTSGEALRTWSTSVSLASYPNTQIDINKTVTSGEGAVFANVLDSLYQAYAKASGWRSSSEADGVGYVKVRYPDPNTTIKYASRYVPKCTDGFCTGGESETTLPATIRIGGGAGWQDGQIIHEYAHHLQYTISRGTPPAPDCQCLGGTCDGVWDNYAWHEGFANYFAGAVLNAAYWGQWTSQCTEAAALANTCTGSGNQGFGMQSYVSSICYTPGQPLVGNSQIAVGMSLWDIFDEDYGAEGHDWIAGWWEYWGYPIQRHIFEVFDNEMDNSSGEMTIAMFHDKLVARNLFVGNHAYYDKVFHAHGQVPHSLSDYWPSSFTASSTSVPTGGNKTFTVTVSNASFTYPDGVYVQIKRSSTVLDSFTLYPPFPATTSRSVHIPTSIGTGSKTITVLVDANNLFTESNESNNTATKTITVTAVCGDSVCSSGENFASCPEDCDPPECFVAGTPITMADGSRKPIEKVAIGDSVLAFDEVTGQPVASEVMATFVHPDTDGLVVVNGVVTTVHHPFYVAGRWVRADALAVGDPLVLAEDVAGGSRRELALGATVVTDLEARPSRATTYNFEVATHHNYFAGGMLVHNIKP